MTTRIQVADAARSWIGTPYHHHARRKGAGVDCGMLIIASFVEAGAVPDFDPGFYTRDWHLHRGEEKYLGFVEAHLFLVQEAECLTKLDPLLPGQVLVWKVGRTYSHGAMVTSPNTFVHASHPSKTTEEIVMRGCSLVGREVRLYDFAGYEA